MRRSTPRGRNSGACCSSLIARRSSGRAETCSGGYSRMPTSGCTTAARSVPTRDSCSRAFRRLPASSTSFDAEEFDYIVIDEFHHAAAPSYRRVIDHFAPKFLLGLTATPDRMDGADLLALCGDNLVYECDLVEGIRRSELVPFRYWGVPDSVDFEPIPWRNGRFEPEMLAQAVETQERAQRALEEWGDRRGQRTLAFCVSTSHADFMAGYFEANGIRAVAVHSGPTSAPRHASLDELRDGRARGRLRRRPLQRGTRRAARRHGADASTHRVAGRVPTAARSRTSHVAGQGAPGCRRLHRQPPQLPAQAADPA